MRTHSYVFVALVLCQAMACSRLIGLDEFHPAPSSNGGAAGMSGAGGDSSGGSVAGIGGSGGASAAAGAGGAGVPAAGDCTRTNLDVSAFRAAIENGQITYHLPVTTELGVAAIPDEFVARVLPVQTQDYDLKDGFDKPDTCLTCGNIEVDVGGQKRVFLSVQGTLGVGWIEEDTFVSNHDGRLFNAIFVEAEQTDDGWIRKADGECLFVPTAEWNYQHNKLPVVTVYDVQTGMVPEDRFVTLADVTVTAKNYNGIWVQSGTGPWSGVRIDASAVQEKIADAEVGDIATIVGRFTDNGLKNQSVIDIREGTIEVTGPGAGTPTATVITGSFGDERWEGVLVRVEGPLTLATVVDEDATLLPHFTATGPNGTVVAQPWLYQPWFDPTNLPRFIPGAEMDSLTGILDSFFDSRQDLMPRSAADFENYTPAP